MTRVTGKDMSAHVKPVLPKTPEMEALLTVGYGMTLDDAKKIIAERESNPQLWPWADYQRAKAMLENYSATKREPTSARPGWQRGPRS